MFFAATCEEQGLLVVLCNAEPENEIENILCFCYCGIHDWEQVCLWADGTGFEAMTIYILPFGISCAVYQ